MYEIIRLPSFEGDVEKLQVKKEKLDKFINDLSKAPSYLKDAHPLKSILEPLWSADFNSDNGLLVVLYFICDGVSGRCFRLRALQNQTYLDSKEILEHICNKKRVYLCRIARHNIYNIIKK